MRCSQNLQQLPKVYISTETWTMDWWSKKVRVEVGYLFCKIGTACNVIFKSINDKYRFGVGAYRDLGNIDVHTADQFSSKCYSMAMHRCIFMRWSMELSVYFSPSYSSPCVTCSLFMDSSRCNVLVSDEEIIDIDVSLRVLSKLCRTQILLEIRYNFMTNLYKKKFSKMSIWKT